MTGGDFKLPNDLYYDQFHNWVRVEGNIATQGMTDLGQTLAEEITFVEISEPSTPVSVN